MKRIVLWTLILLVSSTFAMAQENASGNSSNNNIVREVRHELLLLPYYNLFDNLEYKVDGGTVTLMGQVTDPALKMDAERTVKHIKGVTQVVNQIETLPPSPMDDQIRRAEYRAIYGFPTLTKYAWGPIPPIHIIVKNGHVTLYGAVDNEADKNAATIQAKGVPNVFSVTNNLQVVNQKHE